MSGRRANVIDIREILRRVQLGESDRAIASVLRMSRKTVKKYRLWAEQEGLLEGQLPANDVLHARLQSSMPETLPPLTESTVAP